MKADKITHRRIVDRRRVQLKYGCHYIVKLECGHSVKLCGQRGVKATKTNCPKCELGLVLA